MLSTGMRAASSPMPAMEDAVHRLRSSLNTSTNSRTVMVATRMISGASACQSKAGRVNPTIGLRAASTGSLPGCDRGQASHDTRVGDVEDQVREEAEHDDEDDHRHPGDVVGDVHVVDVDV